jgi:hypothetical protein
LIIGLTIRELLDAAVADGSVAHGDRARVAEALAAMHAEQSPWYVRVLVGAGAWLAACLIGVFLALTGIVDSEWSAIVTGVALLVASTALRKMASGDFAVQLALAANLAGQGLTIFPIAADSMGKGALAALAVTSMEIAFFRDAVLRTVSTAGWAAALAVLLWESRAPGTLDVLAIAAAVCGGLAWRAPPELDLHPIGEARLPVAYGLLGFTLALLALDPAAAMDGGSALLVGPPATIGIGCAVALLALDLVRRATGLGALSEPALLAAASVLVITGLTLEAPGIIASLGAFVLAIERRSRVLFGLACLALIAFTGFFYYSLDITLLAKSGALAGAGATLLGLLGFVRRGRAA